MKPAVFELEVASSVAHALRLLGDSDHEVKVLAGGQSLVPLMNFRLARPDVLVDLNRLAELQYIRESDDGLAIGAMTRQSALERSPLVARLAPLVAEALPLVAHAPIRNRGTLGGSLAHADPAAELCTVALALDAQLVAQSARGERVIAAQDFFVGPFTTALRSDELLTEVRLPRLPQRAGWAFDEVARRRGDFAMVGVAAVLGLDAEGRIDLARLAYTSMGPRPLRAPHGEMALVGEWPTADAFARAAAAAMADLEPGDDQHATRGYRLHVARGLTARALTRALERRERF
ncbi:MAG: xanthine dehydrogenase family protein subunit M [Chloroflexi bacterium]|nr:xanthine dehydrogenase family protein subunit M [Chloroflexota bacterium]